MSRLLTFCLLALFLIPVFSGPAASEEEDERRRWTREEEDPFAQMAPLGPKVKERHERVMELLYEEQYDEAEQELGKIFLKRLNPTERFTIERDYGFIASGKGDRAEARKRFEAALGAQGGYRPEEAFQLLWNIAQLWMQDENWTKAAEMIEIYLAQVPDPDSSAHASPNYMLALCYYQLEKFDKALAAAKRSVEIAEAPQEGWLQLLLALYLLENQYEEAIPLLEELAASYPKKTYYTSLSTVHGALGNYAEAAIPLQMAFELDMLDTDADLRRLGQLLLFLDLPYRSAQLLETGLEEGEIEADVEVLSMLSNSWIAAREYASSVPPLAKAASLSEDGELYVRLAQVHVQREEWPQAIEAIDRALAKGGLEDPGDATLLMGIVLYSQGQPVGARGWFHRARGYESVAKEAMAWIGHIDEELAAAAAEQAEAAEEAERDEEADESVEVSTLE